MIFGGLSMPSRTISGSIYGLTGRFFGSIYALQDDFWVYLCLTGRFFGSIYAPQDNFWVYLCLTGRFLGSVYALQSDFWGLSMPHRTIFGVYLCPAGRFVVV